MDANSTERGFTLIEMLITVWILGAVIVTMCGVLFTTTKASDIEAHAAIVETETRHYIDAIIAAPYKACADTTSYAPANINYVPNASVSASVALVFVWRQKALNDSTITPNFSGSPGAYTSPSNLYATTAGDRSSWATRDRCDPDFAPEDDGVQFLYVTVADKTYTNITSTSYAYKRCDDADACEAFTS